MAGGRSESGKFPVACSPVTALLSLSLGKGGRRRKISASSTLFSCKNRFSVFVFFMNSED